MERRELGKTGIRVSRLCYGSLTLSASQANLSPEEGGDLIAYAVSKGVNFLDTAELYGNYAHIRNAMHKISEPLVISTKSYAYDRKSAEKSLDKARRELDVDVIDLFMLHEQENTMTLLGHREAYDYYLSMKEKGVLRAVGISTHAVEPVWAIAQAKGWIPGEKGRDLSRAGKDSGIYRDCWTEFDPGRYRELDVIHPLLNLSGIGLLDGTAEQMRCAVEAAHDTGVGILGMKMLGGGNLFHNFDAAVRYALSLDAADSYAVGMQSRDEIEMNVALFEGREVSPELLMKTRSRRRKLLIEDWCIGCGSCVKRCKSGALSVTNGKAQADPAKCTLCSYCASACRDFAIKVY